MSHIVDGLYPVKTSKIGPGGKRTLYEMTTKSHIHSIEIDEHGRPSETDSVQIDRPFESTRRLHPKENILAMAFRSKALKMHRETVS